MDVLSDTLRIIRLTGAVFFTARLSAPWSLQSLSSVAYAELLNLPGDCITLFHIVASGECWFSLDRQPAFRARAGDIGIFPHAEVHLMASHPHPPRRADVTQQVLTFSKSMQLDTGIPKIVWVTNQRKPLTAPSNAWSGSRRRPGAERGCIKMDTFLLLTKLRVPPPPPHGVWRTSSIDTLECAIPHHKLILLVAPAGTAPRRHGTGSRK